MKIQGKILATTLPLSLLILGISQGIGGYSSRQALREMASHQLAAKAREGLERVVSSYDRLKAYNEVLSNSGVKGTSVDSEQAKSEVKMALRQIQVGPRGWVFVVDGSSGTVVGHPKASWVGRNVASEEWFRNLASSAGSTFSYWADGEEHLAIAVGFAPWNWRVIASEPLSDIYSILRSSDFSIAVVSVLGAIILLLLTAFTTRRITVPLRDLSEGVRKVEHRNLGVRLEISSQDEVGELARAFNEMTDRLTKSISEQERAEAQLVELNRDLEKRVVERTEALKQAQKVALDNAHAAGMAEIATELLHNVGNIANSVFASTEEMATILKESKVARLSKANSLLGEVLLQPSHHQQQQQEAQGKKQDLVKYYGLLESQVLQEHLDLKAEVERVREKLHLISEVMAAQQEYAKKGMHFEVVSFEEVVREIVGMNSAALARHGVKVMTHFESSGSVRVQRVKLAHILMNLIKNAIEAMESCPPERRVLEISVGNQDQQTAYLKIKDYGVGIAAENLNKVVNHGFTTKKNGHGFGLHFCANAMTEMGGRFLVHSDGLDQGATFTLQFKKG